MNRGLTSGEATNIAQAMIAATVQDRIAGNKRVDVFGV